MRTSGFFQESLIPVHPSENIKQTERAAPFALRYSTGNETTVRLVLDRKTNKISKNSTGFKGKLSAVPTRKKTQAVL